jgi:hypothetical protein
LDRINSIYRIFRKLSRVIAGSLYKLGKVFVLFILSTRLAWSKISFLS